MNLDKCGKCGQCTLCRLAKKDPRYAALFGVDPATIPEARTVIPFVFPGHAVPEHHDPDGACQELGRPLRREELVERGFDPAKCGCQSKVRFCAIHDLCTVTKRRDDGVACCADCKDHTGRVVRANAPEAVLQLHHQVTS
jgi:hypothetical protein